ncbi:thymidine phosphorylase [Crotalus adamanteus]|uniref:Thymidine phosphorylase n=1 Tax=Crotalus adamanteus TaxID=8729 RepID=A0AAW1BEH2_CROAD
MVSMDPPPPIPTSVDASAALCCRNEKIKIGGILLWQSGRAASVPAGAAQIGQALDDGSARDAFQAMLRAQGVPAEVSRLLCEGTEAQRLQVLKLAGNQEELRALQDGTVQQIQAMPIAQVLHELGAGRTQAGQRINPRVGAELLVSTGKRVSKGTPWIRIHYDTPQAEQHPPRSLAESPDSGGPGALHPHLEGGKSPFLDGRVSHAWISGREQRGEGTGPGPAGRRTWGPHPRPHP